MPRSFIALRGYAAPSYAIVRMAGKRTSPDDETTRTRSPAVAVRGCLAPSHTTAVHGGTKDFAAGHVPPVRNRHAARACDPSSQRAAAAARTRGARGRTARGTARAPARARHRGRGALHLSSLRALLPRAHARR